MIVAGIGLRSGARGADVVELIRRAQDQSGHVAQLLAVPEFKQEHAAVLEASSVLSLPLISICRAQLERAQARCPTQSVAARVAIGLGSVAEACALAALEEDGKLVLPRIASPRVTCALAVGSRS